MTDTINGWHFLRADRRLGYYDHRDVDVGVTLTVNVAPKLCHAGLHASATVRQALEYAPSESGLWLCRVRLGGTILHGDDKMCATERTVVAMVEADPLLREWACWCAEAALWGQVVRGWYDDRSWQAIYVTRQWMRGEVDESARDVARAAAWDAAWAAARAAASAAAGDAASAAAGDAALAAAWAAARAAAWAAARDAQSTELERRALIAVGVA